ncbi:MAG: site-specific integrase [Fusobacteriaceae bacterium]|nr:site-specific integrase [Fusobacteriaceae bacterium]
MKEATVQQTMKKWLTESRNFVRESSFQAYRNIVEQHINPRLGEYRLEEMNQRVLQDFTTKLLKNGRVDGRGGLSAKTVQNIVLVLKSGLRVVPGLEWDFRRLSFSRYAGESARKKPAVFTEEEQRKIALLVKENLNCRTMGILFCLSTGIRIGELCAIKWEDVDLEKKTVLIRKTMQRVAKVNRNSGNKTKILLSEPKTKNAWREIPLSTDLLELLTKLPYRKWDYLLSGTKKYVEPRVYRAFFTRFLKKHGIRHIKFHGLRHTFATTCVGNKIDCKVVSELLGHASVTTTFDFYVHPDLEEKRKCVENLVFFQ